MTKQIDPELALIEFIGKLRFDPLGFVVAVFPWGVAGTPLERQRGPRKWQRALLKRVGIDVRNGTPLNEAVREAVASGHGIGKSALVSWLVLWAISTCPHTRGVVTANTDRQLQTKTWPEVGKWHAMAINKHWFTFAATSIHAEGAAEKTWRIDAIPWSDHNTEAFAGLHNQGSRILVIFDEASSISDKIWEVTEGALTDENTEIIWCVFGNPTRNTGRFRECFGRFSHRWTVDQIDSRTVEGINLVQTEKWVEDYGEDSDFVRVRVRGQFPRAGSMQFIPGDLVACAVAATEFMQIADPLIMAIDVARFGDDQSVIRFRRGRNGRVLPTKKFRGVDTMTLAGVAAGLIGEHQPDAVFVDETGIGGAVVDRLRQLGHTVVGVNNGAVSDVPVEGELVGNKAAEMWARAREWLRTGGAIEDDAELIADLEGREYGYNAHNQIILEKKSDMKKRGLHSPDNGDAFCLTFAYPVAPRDGFANRKLHAVDVGQNGETFNPLA